MLRLRPRPATIHTITILQTQMKIPMERNIPRTAIHVGTDKKSFSSQVGNEAERRGWDEKRYQLKNADIDKNNHYNYSRKRLNFEIVKDGKIVPLGSQSVPLHERLQHRLDELGGSNGCADQLTNWDGTQKVGLSGIKKIEVHQDRVLISIKPSFIFDSSYFRPKSQIYNRELAGRTIWLLFRQPFHRQHKSR